MPQIRALLAPGHSHLSPCVGAQIPVLWLGSSGVLSFGAEQKPSRAEANCCCCVFPEQLELNPAGTWVHGQAGQDNFSKGKEMAFPWRSSRAVPLSNAFPLP